MAKVKVTKKVLERALEMACKDLRRLEKITATGERVFSMKRQIEYYIKEAKAEVESGS